MPTKKRAAVLRLRAEAPGPARACDASDFENVSLLEMELAAYAVEEERIVNLSNISEAVGIPERTLRELLKRPGIAQFFERARGRYVLHSGQLRGLKEALTREHSAGYRRPGSRTAQGKFKRS